MKIPKYQLETSLYEALIEKMSLENPLKMVWESNDLIIHTIGKGVVQDVINVHSKPLRVYVGLMGLLKAYQKCTFFTLNSMLCFLGSKRFLGKFNLNPYRFSVSFKDPDNPSDPGFFLKSGDLELSQASIDNFHVDLERQFKTQ